MGMNDKLKDIIKNSKPWNSGIVFDSLLIIPTVKIYDGFFGVNGYNNMFILGHAKDSYYRLDSGDHLYINNLHR